MKSLTDWNQAADRISRGYRRAIERYTKLPVSNIELGKARMVVTQFPKGWRNKHYLAGDHTDPGGWDCALLTLMEQTYCEPTWMSICPMELQSHVNPIRWAQGNVLVGGLGMAYYLREILKSRGVKSVLVVEKEQDVISLCRKLFPKTMRDPRVKIVRADILEEPPKLRFDYAYIDIWRHMGEKQFPDMRRLVRNVKAKRWAYWGMELELCGGVRGPDLKGKTFSDLADELPIPVDDIQKADMAELVLDLLSLRPQ